jgi:undecaprenyl-diphosphatase
MIEQLFNNIIPSLEHFRTLGYWIAFFAALLETTFLLGLFIPGSTVLLLLGVYAAGGHLDWGILLIFAIVGAVLGDNINFWLGRRYGHQWVENGIGFFTPKHFLSTQQFFQAHGGKSVFLGRFIPSIKELVPFIAGTMEMPQRKFMLWNILGAIGWGIQWLGAGYLFAQSLNLAHVWISRIGMAVLFIALLLFLFWLIKRWLISYGQPVITMTGSILRSVKAAIINNPDVHKLVQKHPRFFSFIQKRLDRSHFFGLPVTLLGLAFFYVLMLFAGIVEDFLTSDPIIAVDHHVAQLIPFFRGSEINAFFYWITELGSLQIVLPLLIVSGLVFWILRKPLLILPLLASSLGAFTITLLGKLAFHRPRPDEALLLEHSYSFPSGHATQAVALYGFIAYLLIRNNSQWKSRVNLFFIGALVILLIGLSRMILGVHYLSDIWAGYLVGALCLIIGISITEWLVATGKLTWEYSIPARSRITASLVAAAFLLYYASAAILYPANWLAKPTPISTPLQTDITRQLIKQQTQYTKTFLGETQQPLSVVFSAKDESQLLLKLHQAGWKDADKPSLKNLLRLGKEGMDYTSPPIAPAFWNNQLNDFALEKPWQIQGISMIVTLRLWNTSYHLTSSQSKQIIVVGTVRAFDQMQWMLLHHVYADIDSSRKVLLNSLQQSGELQTFCELPFISPETNNYLLGSKFFTRGQLLLLDLSANQNDKPIFCPNTDQAQPL